MVIGNKEEVTIFHYQLKEFAAISGCDMTEDVLSDAILNDEKTTIVVNPKNVCVHRLCQQLPFFFRCFTRTIFGENLISYKIFPILRNLDTNLFYIFFDSYFGEIKEPN